MNVLRVMKKKIDNQEGVFTIEAVIIFWVVFMVTMVAFTQMAWTFQKAYTAQTVHKELVGSEESIHAKVKTELVINENGYAYEGEIERRWSQIDIEKRLFWLRTARDIFMKVMKDE